MKKDSKKLMIYARIDTDELKAFEEKCEPLGYNKSEVMRGLVQLFLSDKITFKPKLATEK